MTGYEPESSANDLPTVPQPLPQKYHLFVSIKKHCFNPHHATNERRRRVFSEIFSCKVFLRKKIEGFFEWCHVRWDTRFPFAVTDKIYLLLSLSLSLSHSHSLYLPHAKAHTSALIPFSLHPHTLTSIDIAPNGRDGGLMPMMVARVIVYSLFSRIWLT